MTTKEAVEELKSMKYGLGKMRLLYLLFPDTVIKLNKEEYGKRKREDTRAHSNANDGMCYEV